jgi:hypothetical protein
MDAAWTGHFFSLGSCPPANLPIAAGVPKGVLGVLKLGFIQLDGLKTGKWSGVFVGAGLSHLTPSVKSLIFTGEFSPKREIKN